MQVILNMFSGRPDPCWELTHQEVSELARRLTGLGAASRILPEGGLGYSGLTILNPDQMAGIPVKVRVFQGIIGLWENGSPTSYQDRNHVEDWLLALARKRGLETLLDHLFGKHE